MRMGAGGLHGLHESEVKVKSLSCVQLFATPWYVACQAPPSMGFSRQEYWSRLPFPSSGDLPNPGIEPKCPALQADSTVWAARECPYSMLLSHFSRVRLCATPSLGFSRQEHWSGLPFPSPTQKKWSVKVKSLSHVRLFATPWTAAYQAPPSMGFSRQEYWSGVPLPFPNWGASLFQLPSNSIIVTVTTEWNLCVDMSISPLSYHHDHLYLICHYIFTLGIYYALMCVCVRVRTCTCV